MQLLLIFYLVLISMCNQANRNPNEMSRFVSCIFPPVLQISSHLIMQYGYPLKSHSDRIIYHFTTQQSRSLSAHGVIESVLHILQWTTRVTILVILHICEVDNKCLEISQFGVGRANDISYSLHTYVGAKEKYLSY